MDHVFQCDDPATQTLKQTLMDKFYDDLNILGTPKAVRQSLHAGLSWWLLEGMESTCLRAPGFGRIYSSDVWATNAYAEQTSLGWGQLLRGRMSALWGDAYVKEINSGTPKETHEKWTKRVIRMLWKIAFSIWANCNGVLHGFTIEQQNLLKQQKVQNRIKDLYKLYQENPLIIHTTAHYLFEKSLEMMLSKNRQYQLCWIRSVEVAVGYQEQDTAVMRRQATEFFGPVGKSLENHKDEASPFSQRTLNLCDNDISSPLSYSLRRRYLRPTAEIETEDDDWIPPAMFCEYTDDSYTGSQQEDVSLYGRTILSVLAN